jgi:hypothetical protein
MAEGDWTFFNFGKGELQNGNIDLVNDTIKIALINGTPDIDAWEDFADVSTELSGSGYTAGGETLGTKSVDVDDANDRATFDAADVTWTNLYAATISDAIVYKDTGTPGTSTLLAHMEIATNSNGNNYTITFNGSGLWYLT